MLCPYKKEIKLYDNHDYMVLELKYMAQYDTFFEKCDESECMAYDVFGCKCKLIEKGEQSR